jgi:putative PIN family toxin of toxin-antitoxin system
MRVVADTNIYISAILFGGLPGRFLELAFQGRFTLVTSKPLLDELDEKLRGKFDLTSEDALAIRKKIESVAVIEEPGFVLHAIPDDPDDNRVLECAVAGKADFIVSGDRHLLRLGSHAGIHVQTAREFLEGAGLPTP